MDSENNTEPFTNMNNPIVLGADSNAPSAPPARTWSRKRRLAYNRKKWAEHEAARETPGEKENPRDEDLPRVLACPRCGLNIRNVALAIAFGENKELRVPFSKPETD